MANRRLSRSTSFTSYLNSISQEVLNLNLQSGISQITAGSISGSALTGEVVLENNSIRSSNYADRLFGWKIDSEGRAEFSNVYVRGSINAESGSIGSWNISTGQVTRNFGTKELVGTFLESTELGNSDLETFDTTYVALFKSYIPLAFTISNFSRSGGLATIAVSEHNIAQGDYIEVEIPDYPTFNTGSSPALVVSASYSEITYINSGEDIAPDFASDVYGYGAKYVKDVAGLYLRDYSKTLFDYGYFSNEGIKYVSAEAYNLIYNPSFEYLVESTNTAASDSWTADSPVVLDTASLDTDIWQATSTYALTNTWDDASTGNESIYGTIDYPYLKPAINNLNSLVLDFDLFFNPTALITGANASFEGAVGGTSLIVTTAVDHGLAEGEYVASPTIPGVLLKVSGVDSDPTIFYANYMTTTTDYTTIPDSVVVGGTSGDLLYRVYRPSIDLTDISFKFSAGAPIPLYNVLTEDTIAIWDSIKKWSISDWEIVRYLTKTPSVPLPSFGVPSGTSAATEDRLVFDVKLDPAKIYSFYKLQDPDGLAAETNFEILIPAVVTHDDDSLTPPKLIPASGSTFTYYLDNVILSTEKKFFYGGSGLGSSTWSDPANPLISVSIDAAKTWMDIDLETRSAALNYLDYISFKSPRFSGGLITNAGIYTTNELPLNSLIYKSTLEYQNTYSSNLYLTSGEYQFAYVEDTSTTAKVGSYLISNVDIDSSYVQISSDLQLFDGDGEWLETYAASIAMHSATDLAKMYLNANDITIGTTNTGGSGAKYASTLNINANTIFAAANNTFSSNVYGPTASPGDNSTKLATTAFVTAGYQPLDGDLTAIGAISGTSGLLKKTASNTWSLDTSNYVVGINAKNIYYQPLEPGSPTSGDLWIDSDSLGTSGGSGIYYQTTAPTGVSTGALWIDSDSTSAELYAFKTIAVTGSSDIVADVISDTVTFTAGTNISLTSNAVSDTLTISTGTSPAAPANTTSSSGFGFIGMPQVSTATGLSLTATHAGKHIYTTAGSQTHTIPAHASAPLEIGTAFTFINANAISSTVAITSDTLLLAGTTTTGSRTLAGNGMATAVKVANTIWVISGNGLT